MGRREELREAAERVRRILVAAPRSSADAEYARVDYELVMAERQALAFEGIEDLLRRAADREDAREREVMSPPPTGGGLPVFDEFQCGIHKDGAFVSGWGVRLDIDLPVIECGKPVPPEHYRRVAEKLAAILNAHWNGR